jgi:hypothetical protein
MGNGPLGAGKPKNQLIENRRFIVAKTPQCGLILRRAADLNWQSEMELGLAAQLSATCRRG